MDLNEVQISDLGKIYNLQKTIRQREKKKLPVDQLNSKLSTIVTRSRQRTSEIKHGFAGIGLEQNLPITAEADKITELLESNQVVILAGETGCGKTTQLPKICLRAGYGARGLIAHTQPRRVAATSVAKRIADETESQLGDLVGYSIRFNNKLSAKTRVKLMTDGVLLTELESDPLLSRYEVIIIDEAHERSLNIDFLLGFLKQILVKRKELKLIITSATIDPLRFSRNFNNAPMLTVEGRSYPVEVRYHDPDKDKNNSDNVDSLLDRVVYAVDECMAESSGNILIFADGEGQIKTIVKYLQQQNDQQTQVLPLYARLGIKEQQKIFETSNHRKIIVSTNVAETSLTVPGIIFVIDIGTARVSRFSHRNKIQQLPVEKISRASADQRKGRCGRVAPGICIRLYSEDDYQQREEFTCAEIKRTNLSSVVLRLKVMKVENVEHFPFIEPPGERAWKVAFNSLFELGAINQQQQITELGRQMAKLPVDPQLACILVQPKLAAVEEMLIFCSLMSVRDVRERPHEKQQKADQLHKIYHQKDSDILTAINLWRQLEENKNKLSSNGFKKWCSENFINFLGWLEWRKVFFQLKEAVESIGVKVNSTHADADDCHRALIPGFVTHIVCQSPEAHYQGVRGLKVWLHPSSLCFKKNKRWLVSAEMIETEKLFARMNCPIEPHWIEPVAKHLLKTAYNDIHWRKKNGQVMARLNLTLFGLPVANQRLVNYSVVDIVRCREIFLKEALSGDNLTEDFPFMQANRKKLANLTEQEQKQRLNNIRLDDDGVAELYAEVLPEHIVSMASLKKWLKKDYKIRNKQLMFSLEQLTQNRLKEGVDYPSHITIKGFELELSYCFAPGTDQDGVSVDIPPSMLTQFTDRDFDWLVPGYLEEKVLVSLKSLPKSIRRDLIPLNSTAKNCTQELMKLEQTGKRFVDELARVVQRQSGKQIKPADFAMDKIPSHLTMKFKTGKNKTASYLSSLVSVKKNRQQVVSFTTENVSGQSYKCWQFEDFQVEQQMQHKGQLSRVFRGLYDCQDKVIIKEFPSLENALVNHRQGIAKLICMENEALLNQFFNSWPDKKQLERLSIRFEGFRPLFNTITLKWATELIKLAGNERKLTRKQFELLAKEFSENFRPVLSQQLTNLIPLIKLREKIYSQISELNQNALADSINDLKQQLSQLWSSAVFLSAGSELFSNYLRYHDGILLRLKRIKTNYPKEQQALLTWLEWERWWDEIIESEKDFSSIFMKASIYNETFWKLQEYRLSLFSPGAKINGSISAKKLQKQFELLELLKSEG